MMNHDIRIIEAADCLLRMKPDPVPRYRILRDILRRPDGDQELDQAKTAVLDSRWVKELTEEQDHDGRWGRFHSMDSKARAKIATSEAGVARAVQVGLSPGDDVLERATTYLECLLQGTAPWPEHQEPNDRWATGQEMFVAGTLAEIRPDHELLEPVYRKWLEIAERTFSTGEYDREREWRAHCALTGATTMRDSYLVLSNRYAVLLLACSPRSLSSRAEKALVEWLWEAPQGLGYLGVPLALPMGQRGRNSGERWFRSQLIMSRFGSWPTMARDTMRKLWSLQNEDGLWDFGPTQGLRLSESWRRPANRTIDQTVYALLLARAFSDASQPASP